MKTLNYVKILLLCVLRLGWRLVGMMYIIPCRIATTNCVGGRGYKNIRRKTKMELKCYAVIS